MTSEERFSGVKTAAAAEAKDSRGHRMIWVFFAVLLAGVMVLSAVYLIDRATSRDQLSTQDQQIGALVKQVRDLGAVPVVEPAPGARGAAGMNGVNGRDGRDGQNGRDGATPACYSEPNQCRGADGKNGTDGTAGTDGRSGTAGQDGQSPPCLAEPAQCRGADGRDGANGRDGVDGEPGPTCPDGYELRDAVITAPDGSTYSGKACVDPASSAPPSTNPPLPIPGG
ncbi:hypothetical protein ACIBCH_20535 [Amycolatopsis thailandensis]|uniref:hypothetical protein n=1 Tax=Amycolatopsis thailandensis TaxID=589330 RepID=UPI0037B2FE28